MSQSSSSVFVIVEGNKLPVFRATLKDAADVAVPRSSFDANLILKSISGGSPITIPLDWADVARPVHEWIDATLLPVGVFNGEIKTDPDGDDEWTFPTEAGDLFTVICRARLG